MARCPSTLGPLDISSNADDDDILSGLGGNGRSAESEQPDMRGFGSQMISRSISSQLGGSLDYDWQPAGLVATLRIRKSRLAD